MWPATMAASFVAPSGPVSRAAKSIRSSGAVAGEITEQAQDVLRCGDRVRHQTACDHRPDRNAAGTRTKWRRRNCRRRRARPRRDRDAPLPKPGPAFPSASTRSTDSRLSSAMPYLAISQPSPPPSVNPARPVDEMTPPVVASPCSCVARLNSFQSVPPSARAVRAFGSTCNPFMSERSMSNPPSIVPRPPTLCPPPRTATSRPSFFASPSASTTSAAPRQRAITPGRLSTSPL